MSVFRADAAWLLLVLFSGVCTARSTKVAPDLHRTNEQAPLDVIVQFKCQPTAEHHQKVERRGGRLKSELALISAAVYTMSASAADELGDDPDVLYVSPDRTVAALLDNANPTVGAPLALSHSWDGTGVGIAIIDSGVMPVRDLLRAGSSAANSSRIVYSQNFVAGTVTTSDQYGHGTHVAGIAAGNANASTGSSYFRSFRGIAPNASLINLRVLDANGSGKDSGVIAAIDRAIQLKNRFNIRVINLSLGRPVYESYTKDPLCRAVERAWNAGIVVVVAAGNEGRNAAGTDGYATIASPGNDPFVITVGAMNTRGSESRADDLIASYSSKGPTLLDHIVKPDLVAPGNRVVGLVASRSLVASKSTTANKVLYSYYQNTTSRNWSVDYYRLSGTSMAAPVVSGAAAVMLHKDWSLTPDTIKARMMRTATKTFPPYSVATDPGSLISYTSQYDIFTVGAGYLDLWAALNDVQYVPSDSCAASPVAVLDATTGTVLVVNADPSVLGKAAVWGTEAVWGTAAVWGTSVFETTDVWGTAAVWGSAAVWGTGGMSGNAAVWGTAAVWGSTTNTTSEKLSQLINGEN